MTGPSTTISDVPITPLPLDRFAEVVEPGRLDELRAAATRAREALAGRTLWNVNSTAKGGGVAEMLDALLPYVAGAGVDVRWVVIGGDHDFFAITKRIHNRLHGQPGDGGDLGEATRTAYERTLAPSARALGAQVRPGDVVLLHDPQTAGLIEPLRSAGASVVWRCHVGLDHPNGLARETWMFLRRYVDHADCCVFTCGGHVWEGLSSDRIALIPPSIDAFSPKNAFLTPEEVAAALAVSGIVPSLDGDPGATTVRRHAGMEEDEPVPADVPLVVQVSRWDRLKDPEGVLRGFADHVAPSSPAHLVLAGPAVDAVSDDPEGAEVLEQVCASRDQLPAQARRQVHVACLPMDDGHENATMVNALQRYATVVVQKSLAEGFGLTVAEAMWKERPVVASAVGGIREQIVDGETGLLLAHPSDLASYGEAVMSLLDDPELAARLGRAARTSVRDHFLAPRHLLQYAALFDRITG
jgi:trehalose synthase